MPKKIMIATHTILAEGFKKAMIFFTGQGEDVITVCAYENTQDDPRNEIEAFFASVEPGDVAVVFTDLIGGSVNQILSEKLKTTKFHLITDVNLSVVMAVATLSEEEINAENIRESIELSKANIKYMNDVLTELNFAPKTENTDDFFA